MTSIMLATPSTRAPEWDHVHSLMYSERVTTTSEEKYAHVVVEGQAIDVARNTIVSRFLPEKRNFDYLVMADSDATWAAAALKRLLSYDLPVISAVIFTRDLPPLPIFGPLAGKDSRGMTTYALTPGMKKIWERVEKFQLNASVRNDIMLPQSEDDLFPVDGVGCHFIAIRRDVLEKIKPPWFYCTVPNAGEDFYFCQKVRKAGFSIHVDLSIYTGHIFGPGKVIGLSQFIVYYMLDDNMRNKETNVGIPL